MWLALLYIYTPSPIQHTPTTRSPTFYILNPRIPSILLEVCAFQIGNTEPVCPTGHGPHSALSHNTDLSGQTSSGLVEQNRFMKAHASSARIVTASHGESSCLSRSATDLWNRFCRRMFSYAVFLYIYAHASATGIPGHVIPLVACSGTLNFVISTVSRQSLSIFNTSHGSS